MPPSSAARVGFSTPKKWNFISWLIMSVTGSKSSHAWILYFSDRFKCEMVMDAHLWGNRVIRFEDFKKKNVVIAVYTPRYSIDDGLPEAAKWLGTTYDFPGLLGMGLVLLGRWLKRKWRNPFANAQHVFCTEWVIRTMLASSAYAKSGLEPNDDPQTLAQYFEIESVDKTITE